MPLEEEEALDGPVFELVGASVVDPVAWSPLAVAVELSDVSVLEPLSVAESSEDVLLLAGKSVVRTVTVSKAVNIFVSVVLDITSFRYPTVVYYASQS